MPPQDPSSPTVARPWFAASERDALADFWAVYDGNYERITSATLAVAREDPQLAAILGGMSPEQLEAQNRKGREDLRHAVGGAWAEYEASLRQQGATYAQMGLAYSAWYRLVRAVAKELIPGLAAEYASAPERHTGALLAM